MATISILGLYNWDDTIFDEMVMPEYIDGDGISHTIDKDALIGNILLELGEMETLFPNSEKMKEILKIWSSARVPSWSRMLRVLIEDYDPFINIRRHEHREITQDRDLTGSASNKVNAWNTPTSASDRERTDTTDKGQIKTTEDYTLEGDSAITDAQDVMKKEIEIRAQYNIYDIIIEEFKRRFCLAVY